jgi:hypothetical protein
MSMTVNYHSILCSCVRQLRSTNRLEMERLGAGTMKTTAISAMVAATLLSFCTPTACAQNPTSASTVVALNGVSSGGTLTLMRAPEWNYPYIEVTNEVGEAASSTLNRIARQLSACAACSKSYGGNPVAVANNELRLQDIIVPRPGCTSWILGGTDRGFNIPSPPAAVSASVDSTIVTVAWENPPGDYDSILVLCNGIACGALPGTATRLVYDRRSVIGPASPTADTVYIVIGCRHGTPSNGSGIRLRRYVEQESVMNVPFTAGIAPGYEGWMSEAVAGRLSFVQGHLPGVEPGTEVRNLQGKGFLQTIHGQGPVQGGVQRRFLGLNPGHTYRVGARISVLGAASGSWAFSFHAAGSSPGNLRLSEAQMAGRAALPSGRKGPTAAQVARYDSRHYTKGQWVTLSSDVPGADNQAGDVTLPAGTDSITLWFRLEGSDGSDVTAAFDSLTLEDLGSK